MFDKCLRAVSLIMILLLSILGPSYCQTNASTEAKALLDLKAENAANSTHVRGWLAGRDHCKPKPWKGLSCWSSGYVRWLRLPNSNLSGNISSALGGLRALTRVDLRDNQLVGDIPADLRTLVHLKRFLLSGNRLEGTIPDLLRKITLLEQLLLADNRLEGNIPSNLFTKLTRLWSVDMSNNRLTGPISDNLINLASLKTVVLGGNKFSGPVPSSLASSSSLQTVDLSGNSLAGVLPLNWTSSNLTSLNLSTNQLTGRIPSALLNLPALVNLSLAGNNFTGDVSGTASCRFGALAFAENPNLSVEPCPNQAVSPGPAEPTIQELPQSPTGAENLGPSPRVREVGKDSNGPPRSRILLILLLVAGNLGMIILAAVLISVFYVYCKKRGQADPRKSSSEAYTIGSATHRQESASRSARTSSAGISVARACAETPCSVNQPPLILSMRNQQFSNPVSSGTTNLICLSSSPDLITPRVKEEIHVIHKRVLMIRSSSSSESKLLISLSELAGMASTDCDTWYTSSEGDESFSFHMFAVGCSEFEDCFAWNAW